MEVNFISFSNGMVVKVGSIVSSVGHIGGISVNKDSLAHEIQCN